MNVIKKTVHTHGERYDIWINEGWSMRDAKEIRDYFNDPYLLGKWDYTDFIRNKAGLVIAVNAALQTAEAAAAILFNSRGVNPCSETVLSGVHDCVEFEQFDDLWKPNKRLLI